MNRKESTFSLRYTERNSAVFILKSDKEENTLTLSLQAGFEEGVFNSTTCFPTLCIREHETAVTHLHQLIGKSFCVSKREEALEREDFFHLFKSVLIESYQLHVVAVSKQCMRIRCKGVLITDVLETPSTKIEFDLDGWFPIITRAEDWYSELFNNGRKFS